MNIGIIGAGSMGSGIAQVAATAGEEVMVFDTNAASLDKASASLTKIMNRLVEKERVTRKEADDIFGINILEYPVEGKYDGIILAVAHDEFKEYAFVVLQKAFGDEFEETKAQEVVDGLITKHSGDYGAMVGALTSSLGQ